MKPRYVRTRDCVPMPELLRDFYNPPQFAYLKRVIAKDGFKTQYSVRGIWNRRKKKHEIFDGIHRWKVAEALGIAKIPLIDETGMLTRQKALAEGIKANVTHAPYDRSTIRLPQ